MGYDVDTLDYNFFFKAGADDYLDDYWPNQLIFEKDAGGTYNFWGYSGRWYDEIDNLFTDIAPYVEAGSYIDWSNDYNDLYRFKFDGNYMKKVPLYLTESWPNHNEAS